MGQTTKTFSQNQTPFPETPSKTKNILNNIFLCYIVLTFIFISFNLTRKYIKFNYHLYCSNNFKLHIKNAGNFIQVKLSNISVESINKININFVCICNLVSYFSFSCKKKENSVYLNEFERGALLVYVLFDFTPYT